MSDAKFAGKTPSASKGPTRIANPQNQVHPVNNTMSELQILASIKRNWNIRQLHEIIADHTWFKGIQDPSTVLWKFETLVAFKDLSMKSNEKDDIKGRLSAKWMRREHSRRNRDIPGENVNIGQNWEEKQTNMIDDIRWIMQDLDLEAIIGQLTTDWKLARPRDAIPVDLRDEKWKGHVVEKWGPRYGSILEELGRLAATTKGRHALVLKKLREIAGKGKLGENGVMLEDLEKVFAFFNPGIVRVPENRMEIDGEEEINDFGEKIGDGQHPAPTIRDRSSSLATAMSDLSTAINGRRDAEIHLDQARNDRDHKILSGNPLSLEVIRADLDVAEAGVRLDQAKATVTNLQTRKDNLEVYWKRIAKDSEYHANSNRLRDSRQPTRVTCYWGFWTSTPDLTRRYAIPRIIRSSQHHLKS